MGDEVADRDTELEPAEESVEEMAPFIRVIKREELESMPVETVEDVLEIQSDVVREDRRLHVRGGSGDDILWVVDGMPIRFPPSRLGISIQDIEEIQIITGGFAEYEAATVVKIVTREEGPSRFSGGVLYKTDDYGGLRGYSFNTDRLRFSLGGPEPITSYGLPEMGLRLPGRITYYLSGTGYRTDTHTPFDIERPSHTWYGIRFGDRQGNTYMTNWKLSYRISPAKTLSAGYRESWRRGQDYQHEYKYVPENACQESESEHQWGIGWEHRLTPGNYYSLQLGKLATSYSVDHGFDPGYWWDHREEIGFGRKDSLGFYRTGTVDNWCIWHEHEFEQWTLKGDMSLQAGRANLVKAGLDLNYFDIYNGEIQYPQYPYPGHPDTTEPWYWCGVIRDFYVRRPFSATAHVQNEFTREEIVLQAGLRYGYWNPPEQAFSKPPIWWVVYVKSKQWLSPRVAISYLPVKGTTMWLSFGCVSHIPSPPSLYKQSTVWAEPSSGSVPYGNPDLNPERAFQACLGMEHLFVNEFSVTMLGFSRNTRGMVVVMPIGEPPFERLRFENEGRSSVEGVEFRLSKKIRDHTALSACYTVQQAKSNVRLENPDTYWPYPIRYKEDFPTDWDRRHSIVVNLGLQLPGNWQTYVLWRYGSGLPFTASPPLSEPDEGVNARRMPSVSTLDLKARKGFHLGSFEPSLILEVRNLFNRTNVVRVHGDTGLPGGETPEGEWEEVRDDPANWGPGRNILVGLGVGW